MRWPYATARFVALPPSVVGASGSLAGAQTGLGEYTRQSDVIDGHTFGVALTLEVFAPAKRNGLGVVWVVSSNGRSSREQTLQPSFERRISPVLAHGYTVFAVMHAGAPVLHVQDHVQDVRRAVRFVRHRATDFGIDPQRLGIGGSSAPAACSPC